MNKKNKKIRLMGGVLVLLFFFLLVSPSLHANDDVCVEALDKCTTKAFIAGLFFGGPFLLFMSHCLLGYSWCLKYYAV